MCLLPLSVGALVRLYLFVVCTYKQLLQRGRQEDGSNRLRSKRRSNEVVNNKHATKTGGHQLTLYVDQVSYFTIYALDFYILILK